MKIMKEFLLINRIFFLNMVFGQAGEFFLRQTV
jgi:hypothetical protein